MSSSSSSITLGIITALCLILYIMTIPKYTVLPGSYGFTSKIYVLPDTTPPQICKSINPDCTETHFPVEKEAYERFNSSNPPTGILQYYGVHDTIPSGLILEYAELGDVREYIWIRNQRGLPPPEMVIVYKWALQATEALEFAHNLGVYNSDIHCVNFFLTATLDLKVGDWAGASIDGGRSHSSYRYKHRLFAPDGTDVVREGISAETEVFAMGAALYYLVVGEEVWPELEEPEDREDIRKKIVGRMWPDLGALRGLGDVILGCWDGEYKSMGEVKLAVEAERDSIFGAEVVSGVGGIAEEVLLVSSP